jgi:hypothetical protein
VCVCAWKAGKNQSRFHVVDIDPHNTRNVTRNLMMQ